EAQTSVSHGARPLHDGFSTQSGPARTRGWRCTPPLGALPPAGAAVSVRRMHRFLPTITGAAALLATAARADAAAKSCTRNGAKLLAADGRVRVVSVKEKPQNSETRRDRIYGCWTATGRRFT